MHKLANQQMTVLAAQIRKESRTWIVKRVHYIVCPFPYYQMIENYLKDITQIYSYSPLSVTQKMESFIKDETLIEQMRLNETRVEAIEIQYYSGKEIINGFIISPKKKIAGKLPVIIYNRGGSKDYGTLKYGHVFTLLSEMAQWEYIVIASQYRGAAKSTGTDNIGGEDIKDVLVLKEIIEQIPVADTNNIYMYGASRGGLMVYRCLQQVTWIKAAVSTAGVSNYFTSYKNRPELKEFHSELYDTNSEDEIKKRSVVFWSDEICPASPLLLIHGSNDKKVSVEQSRQLFSLLKDRENCRYIEFEGDDHYLSKHKKEEQKLVRDWFARIPE